MELQLLQSVFGLYFQVLVGVGQPTLQLLRLVKGLLFEGLPPFDFGPLEVLELPVEQIAKRVHPILPLLLVGLNLPLVDSLPELVLPASNLLLQTADLVHQRFELHVKLQVEAVVGDQLETFLDEGKNADLLVGAQHPVLVLVEDPHELLY